MIYVCSDIHGLYEVYEQAVQKITKDDTLYILGDVIDRGQDGIQIIKDIMQRSNIKLFIGNHEYMMLHAMRDNDAHWQGVWHMVNNGGGITKHMFMHESKSMRKDILDFLYDCALIKRITVNGKDFILTHSGPNPKGVDNLDYKDADEQTCSLVTWHSPFRTDNLYISPMLYREDATYIVGHVPVQKFGWTTVMQYENIIDIDCGCAYQHLRSDTSLAMLCLDTGQAEYFQCQDNGPVVP